MIAEDGIGTVWRSAELGLEELSAAADAAARAATSG
jgi:hypothetical protein